MVKFLENLLMDIIRTFNPYVVEEKAVRLGMMVYTCNFQYLRGRDRRVALSLKPAWAIDSETNKQTNKNKMSQL